MRDNIDAYKYKRKLGRLCPRCDHAITDNNVIGVCAYCLGQIRHEYRELYAKQLYGDKNEIRQSDD